MPTLRRMRRPDVELVRGWLQQPHVAEWYLAFSSIDSEIRDLLDSVDGRQPTEALLVVEDQDPIGWCQWYRCADYPDHALGVDADPDDVGIDYAIGETTCVRRGIGTALVAELVGHVRAPHPTAAIIADPDAANVASRRVLEKNGFQLVDERVVASDPSPNPMAIYRLTAPTAGSWRR